MERQPYIRLNFESENPGRSLNVEQVVRAIRSQITSDRSFRGCRLPPVRALAHQLSLSKNTIQTAYDELRAQGLIESRDRSGIFISGDSPSPSARSVTSPSQVPRPEFKKAPDAPIVKLKQPGFTHLSTVFVDPRLLPKAKLTACFKSVLKSPGIPEFHDPQGMPALREKIASRLRNRGISVKADHIIITNGSQQALDLVTRALATKVVGTEDPSYYLGKCLFEMNGIQAFGLPIDPFRGIDESAWEKRIAENHPGLIYLTTNFQNANGYSYSSGELAKIVQWAKKFGFGILEDDWGAEMLSYSEFRPGLRALGGSNVLYMNSFTKKLLPSMRIGYLAANDETIEALQAAKRVSTIAAPGIIEAALFEFLDRGYYDTHLKHVQSELDVRYEQCQEMLRALMPNEAKWTAPGGGPVLWLELPKRIALKELQARLHAKKVLIQLSDRAFFGKPHSHGFKIGYAFLSQQEMQDALEKTAREIRSLLRV